MATTENSQAAQEAARQAAIAAAKANAKRAAQQQAASQAKQTTKKLTQPPTTRPLSDSLSGSLAGPGAGRPSSAQLFEGGGVHFTRAGSLAPNAGPITDREARNQLNSLQLELKQAKNPQSLDLQGLAQKASALNGELNARINQQFTAPQHDPQLKSLAAQAYKLSNAASAANTVATLQNELHGSDPQVRTAANAWLLANPHGLDQARQALQGVSSPVTSQLAQSAQSLPRQASESDLARQLQADPDLSHYPAGVQQSLEALKGGSTPGMRQALQGVAERSVQNAAAQGPQQGAQALSESMKLLNPADRAAALQHLGPQLQQIAKGVGPQASDTERQDMMNTLAQVAQSAGPTGAQAIAAQLVPQLKGNPSGLVGLDSKNTRLIAGTVDHTADLTLAKALIDAPGIDSTLKGQLNDGIAIGIDQARSDFSASADRADELNGNMEAGLAQLAPAMTAQDKQTFVKNWKADHADDYTKFEQAGAKLSGLLSQSDQLLSDPNASAQAKTQTYQALKELPRLGETSAGEQLIAGALKNPASQLIQNASQVADKHQLGSELLSVVGRQLAGDPKDASNSRLIDGLEQHAELFGLKRGAASTNQIFNDLHKMMSATDQSQLQQGQNDLQSVLGSVKDTLDTFTSEDASGFRGLSALLGLVKASNDVTSAQKADEIAQAALGTIGGSADAAKFMLQSLFHQTGDSSLVQILGKTGDGAAALLGIANGISRYVKGGASNDALGTLDIGVGLLAAVNPELGLPAAFGLGLVELAADGFDKLDKLGGELSHALRGTSLSDTRPQVISELLGFTDPYGRPALTSLTKYYDSLHEDPSLKNNPAVVVPKTPRAWLERLNQAPTSWSAYKSSIDGSNPDAYLNKGWANH